MTEILKEGHYEKPKICFRCNRCGTEFRTDEYLTMHAPRIEGSKQLNNDGYLYASCPVCRGSIDIPIKFHNGNYEIVE